jgi:hypothetical protein
VAVEAINGGVGHYGPFHYAAFAEKHMALAPAMLVVVLYTGNDFLDGIQTAVLRRVVQDPPRPGRYAERLRAGEAHSRAAVAQALNQVVFFQVFPDLERLAVDLAAQQLVRIAVLCAPRRIRLAVLLLPTKCDVEWPREPALAAERDALLSALELCEADLSINRRMALALLAQLEAQDIASLDLLPALERTQGKVFWDVDYHLNPDGQAAIALAFTERFTEALVRR